MSKTGAYYLEKRFEMEDLYAKVEEAVMAINKVEELPGLQQLSSEHRANNFKLVKSELEDFLSLIDDYMRGDIE